MKLTRTHTAAMLLGALLALPAKSQMKPEVGLRAAMETETVKGDLKGAIEQYRKIAQGSDRAIAAKALIHMAECYQKMGDAESRKIYEQVIREYTDQKGAAAVARARLGGDGKTLRDKGDRAVWTGPMVDLFGRVSPDGRFITFIDWNNGSLLMHDVASNVDRVITPPVPFYAQSADWSAISSDSKRVMYAWSNKDRREIRVIGLQGNGFTEPRRIFTSGEDVRFIGALDWSPDGKWIAVANSLKDGTGQIGVIAVEDGALRVLKSV